MRDIIREAVSQVKRPVFLIEDFIKTGYNGLQQGAGFRRSCNRDKDGWWN